MILEVNVEVMSLTVHLYGWTVFSEFGSSQEAATQLLLLLVGTAIVPQCPPMVRRSGAYGASRSTWLLVDGPATERAPTGKVRLGPGVRAESAHTRRPARGLLPT